ncbi:MAG: hypothetical protein KTR33_09905 [Gammaproteobacteria bacterium]|nr:hypothetical protein [Gammaproteobacteria bacterium]
MRLIIMLHLTGAMPVGAADQTRNLDTEHFAGTLFFTPEQRNPARSVQHGQTSGSTSRSKKLHTPETAAVVVSFDGLLQHGSQSIAWVNGRPLELQSLPDSIQQVRVDLERRQLIIEATTDDQHTLAIGDCLWSDNRVGPCASAANLAPAVSAFRRTVRLRRPQ